MNSVFEGTLPSRGETLFEVFRRQFKLFSNFVPDIADTNLSVNFGGFG